MTILSRIESTLEAQQQVELTRSQLHLYARDLKQVLQAEREKTRQLELANRQLQAYAHDLKTAFDAERRKAGELERAHYDTVRRLVAATRWRDQETGAHVTRISYYARLLALHLGWKPEAAALLFQAAPMHDVGKIGVPDAILRKPGPLTEEEWRQLKRHTEIGYRLLKGSTSPLLELASCIALTHHERWDGSGYPQQLKGEQIPMAGRIVMLVDQYDALRTARPYKPALTHQQTCQVLLEGDGRTSPRHFDPRLLAAFRRVHAEFEAIYERFHD